MPSAGIQSTCSVTTFSVARQAELVTSQIDDANGGSNPTGRHAARGGCRLR